MGVRFGLARGLASISTWGLKHVFHRPAANFPGKIALYADPQLLSDLRSKVKQSICVVGTNGKTTVNNLIADCLEDAGFSIICNRTGANLDSGVSTALLQGEPSDWGVFECDELWLVKILPHLQSRYVVLLNLFRDQLDRVGEIDHIQESIAKALTASPETTLIYNCDDPLCQAIADKVQNSCIPFGISEPLGLEQNTVADARMCQQCDSMLDYAWRQYGQLGSYSCPSCGFARTEPEFAATDVQTSAQGVTFTLTTPSDSHAITTQLTGSYIVYNLVAVATAAHLAGAPWSAIDSAIAAFNPRNGRLQNYDIDEHRVLLNLAKNPTGFNQNLRIVMQDEGPKAVAFYINDKEADGHDVSWLWDIDFQELADANNLIAFAGGIRKNDMQVRLRYAGVPAQLVDGVKDFMEKVLAECPDANLYVIANYTALPAVKDQLDRLEAGELTLDIPAEYQKAPALLKPAKDVTGDQNTTNEKGAQSTQHLTIVHLYPKLLNLYGDGGNVIVLAQRARWRGIDTEVITIDQGDSVDLAQADIVFLGGGPDREQHLASQELLKIAPQLRDYVENDGVLLAICGGFQILGKRWLLGDSEVPGLDIIDIDTGRREGGSHNRLVGNVVLNSPLAERPVVGYENHAGRTTLGNTQTGEQLEPFGGVIGNCGKGNNDTSKADGVLYKNVVGTYLHGPLLAKNPQVADALIERALKRRAFLTNAKDNVDIQLASLDDSVELQANAFMCEKLNAPIR